MIKYKGFKIEKETDPWALKYKMLYRFYRDERLHSGSSIEDCKDQIDELTCND